METLKLRNGAVEKKSLVNLTMFSLEVLSEKDPVTFLELVEVCRDSTHELWGDTGDVLRKRKLIQPNGRPHESIKNIVLSATQGSGLDFVLRSPVGE